MPHQTLTTGNAFCLHTDCQETGDSNDPGCDGSGAGNRFLLHPCPLYRKPAQGMPRAGFYCAVMEIRFLTEPVKNSEKFFGTVDDKVGSRFGENRPGTESPGDTDRNQTGCFCRFNVDFRVAQIDGGLIF